MQDSAKPVFDLHRLLLEREAAMATSLRTRGLALAASAVGGLLAGGNVDRLVVGFPAWRRVGTRAWADYSRHADLSANGMALYPFLAIGGATVSIAALASFRRDRRAPARAGLPLSAAAFLTIGGLLVTTQAAPNMLRLRRLGNDRAALQRAFEGFYRWSAVRAVFQVLAFGANLWSLAALRK